MSSHETISKNDILQTIDIKTATALFYIGLIILAANLAYFYTPIASCILIFILFIQKNWKIKNLLFKIATLITLIPLLIILSAAAFQQLLIVSFSGISSLGSDVHINFSREILNAFAELVFFMMVLSISSLSALLFLLSIGFPIWKMFFRITITPVFFICMLAGFFLSLLGGLKIYVDLSDYLTGKYNNPAQLVIDKKLNDYHIRAYRTNYEGALGSFGIEIKQEKALPFGMTLVREINNYYPCSDVQLNIVGNNVILIKPEKYRQKDTETMLKIFALKPFYTTKFLKYLSQN